MPKSLKETLTFDHSTGKIDFRWKTYEDLIILPTFENLRILGKISRYFILYMCCDVDCRKTWGKNYFFVKDDDKNIKILAASNDLDKELLLMDGCIGAVEYTLAVTLIVKMFKPIFTLIGIGFALKILMKPSKKKFF